MIWNETLMRDLWYGARLFLRQPATTFLAVLTLSLGIGANIAIYSLLHAALLRPLPFPASERLVAIVDNLRAGGARTQSPTVPELLDVRSASRLLEGISFFDMRDVQVNGGTEPARAFSARIEAGFLGTLGVRPALGRLFTQDDHTPGRDGLVILTDAFWRRNFGANPSIVSRSIVVNNQPHTVVGVLPPDFSFDYLSAEPIDMYVPFPMEPSYTSRTGEYANVRRVTGIARMRPGVSLQQAAAELGTVSQQLRTDHPALYRRGSDGADLGFYMSAVPLREIFVGRARSVVVLLFAAVGLVLLIACVNTAQFLLARAVERQQEVAIRTALGAGGRRLLRQFLTEAALLAFVSAVIGVLQAVWLVDWLTAVLASRSPLLKGLGVDLTAVGFSLAIAIAVTLSCGLFPAIHFVRGAVHVNVPRTTTTTRSRTRHTLVAVQVAVSVVLLVCAGLLVEGIRQLQNAPRGYSSENVTLMRLRIAGSAAPGRTGATYEQYLSRIATVPGVAAAAVADAPLPGSGGFEFSIVGRADDAATLAQQGVSWRIVSPGYFSVLGIPVLSGRTFDDSDSAGRAAVTVINETMARRFWPGENPIGAQIRSGVGPRASVATIIGVVGDVRPLLQREVGPQMYMSYLQQSEPNITLLVRSLPGSNAPVEAIKHAVWSLVPQQPLYNILPMADVVNQSMAEPRVIARLLGAFALLALLMSTLGVYTVVSYVTARRTKEVAVRRAIGATSFDVLRLLGIPTMAWTAAGLVVGVIGALAAAAFMRTIVIGAAPPDPATIAAVTSFYLAIVAIAVVVPAAHALRIHPARVLRSE